MLRKANNLCSFSFAKFLLNLKVSKCNASAVELALYTTMAIRKSSNPRELDTGKGAGGDKERGHTSEQYEGEEGRGWRQPVTSCTAEVQRCLQRLQRAQQGTLLVNLQKPLSSPRYITALRHGRKVILGYSDLPAGDWRCCAFGGLLLMLQSVFAKVSWPCIMGQFNTLSHIVLI